MHAHVFHCQSLADLVRHISLMYHVCPMHLVAQLEVSQILTHSVFSMHGSHD